MNIEDIRRHCLALPCVTEDMPFDDSYLCFRVGGKIFCGIPLEKSGLIQLKCDPAEFDELLATHPYLSQAWHWHKRHWIQLSLHDDPPRDEVLALIRRAHEIVVAKLPKKTRKEMNI